MNTKSGLHFIAIRLFAPSPSNTHHYRHPAPSHSPIAVNPMAAEEPAGAGDFLDVLLGLLDKAGSISSTLEVAAQHGVDHQNVVIKSLKTLEAANFAVSQKVTFDVFEATDEGKGIVAAGKSPEKTLFDALTEEGVETAALQEALGKGVVGVGMGPNMKNKWAQKKGSLICRKADPGKMRRGPKGEESWWKSGLLATRELASLSSLSSLSSSSSFSSSSRTPHPPLFAPLSPLPSHGEGHGVRGAGGLVDAGGRGGGVEG